MSSFAQSPIRLAIAWGFVLFAVAGGDVAAQSARSGSEVRIEADEPDSPYDAVLESPETGFVTVSGEMPAEPSYRELLDRLERAEHRVEALEADRDVIPAAGEADLKAPTAVDHLQRHWERVRDPSIITVDQQTRKVPSLKDEPKKWYERLSIRGYAQFRYNNVLSRDEDSAPAQNPGDRSIGENQSYLIRRARVIISGDVSDHMYIYLQPDFASTVPGSADNYLYAQIRDWYADLYLDSQKVYRFRVGQSKVPYCWENLQSSSNRLALDRNDAINSAVRNERDLGVFFYWTPGDIQDLFKEVLDDGLKGSGNYGMLGVGVYNGQGGSLLEQNDDVHSIARFAYPFRVFDDQIAEVGIQGYTGRYVVLSSQIRALGVGPLIRPLGTLETNDRKGLLDQRVAGTFIWYPKPFGFQSEWTVGRGPSLNDAQNEVIVRSLSGGYAMFTYRYRLPRHGVLFPFVKWNYYQGGYKPERNAPYSRIDELEAGIEWQINDQVEIVTQYTLTDRTNTTAFTEGRSYEQFEGQLLRCQLQVNY